MFIYFLFLCQTPVDDNDNDQHRLCSLISQLKGNKLSVIDTGDVLHTIEAEQSSFNQVPSFIIPVMNYFASL